MKILRESHAKAASLRKLLIVSLLALCSEAFGQAAYSGSLTAFATTSVGNPLTTVVTPAAGATITVYAFGTLTKAAVCPDSTAVGCTAIAPNNPITADSQGNFGFYIAAGAYDYTILPVGGTVQGPYHIFLPLGITSPNTINLGSLIATPAQGGTGANNAATSGRFLKGNGTNFVTSTGAASGVGAVSCTNQVPTSLTLNSDAAPSGFGCTTLTSAYVNNSIALTGTDINTSNQVTATHLASALPLAQGGTGQTSATGTGLPVLQTSPTINTPSISSPNITSPQILTGISQASGFKHQRFGAGCATAASLAALCDSAENWSAGFADANYTVTCVGTGTTSGVPLIQKVYSKLAAGFTITTSAQTAAAAQYSGFDCIAVHD